MIGVVSSAGSHGPPTSTMTGCMHYSCQSVGTNLAKDKRKTHSSKKAIFRRPVKCRLHVSGKLSTFGGVAGNIRDGPSGSSSTLHTRKGVQYAQYARRYILVLFKGVQTSSLNTFRQTAPNHFIFRNCLALAFPLR